MKFKRPESRSEEVFINLTPLIDVVFLLLIFFMVSTTFTTIRYGIKVDLPKTTTPQEKVEENIVVSITKEGQMYVGKTWIKDEDKLVAILREKIQQSRDRLVVINADREVKHGQVVEAMDLAKKAGAVHLGVLTTPKEE